MFRSLILLLITAVSFNAFSQNKKEIIAQIDSKKIYKEEFVRLYEKNNNELFDEGQKKTPKEYIDLFINYKLKVHEAEQLGMDTIPSFLNELNSYRKELARPYLTDVHFTDQMVNEMYKRSITELKASHILLRLNEGASPADTLTTYNKLIEIREKALSGADFGKLAAQYSEDPSAINNKGLLGYFSAFQMVYPFEDAAYKTPVGEISMPVRTRFGYHLIQVLDKRPASGQIKVAHIMKKIPQHASEEAVNKAKLQMDSIASLIANGSDFSQLAKQFSDDRQSANEGGEMNWFSLTNMLPEFAKPAFELKNDGDISKIIQTPYGLHIIKRIAYKPVPSFSEIEQQLIDKIRKNPAISQHSKKQFIQKLKNDYCFSENNDAPSKFFKLISQKGKSEFEKHINDTLFSYAKNVALFRDLNQYLAINQLKDPDQKSLFDQHYHSFIEKTLVDFEDSQLEKKYPAFRYLMQEYHDGILLFNISEEKIWSKASSDTTGLEAFYQKNKGLHLWGERFKGWVVKCPNQEVKDYVDQVLSSDSELSLEELQDQVKQNFDKNIDLEKDAFEKGDNPLVDYFVWNGLEPDGFQEGLQFIRGDKVTDEEKSLQEARGLYISDYQDYLEQQWIKELRKKYKVKINRKLLKSVDPV